MSANRVVQRAVKGTLGRQLGGLARRGLSDRLFTAVCYEVQWQGKRVARGEHGRLSARSKFAATRSTLFDMASLTKPTATALAVMRLARDRRLKLETTLEEICERLPDLTPEVGKLRCHASLRPVTLRNLLTHTSGIAAWDGLYKQDSGPDEVLQVLLGKRPKHKPGTRYEYSCLGYIVLGKLVNAFADRPLDAYVREELHLPAGMKSTGYCPGPADRRRAAATELCLWRGKRARGFVHDENAYFLGGVSGNAGLFSTASDLSRFCRKLLSPEQFDLPPRLFNAYTRNQLKGLGAHSSCGWFVYDSDMLPRPPGFSPRSFGHTGFTGTSAIIDPANEGFAFVLTNRVYFGRDFAPYGQWRRAFYDTVGEHLARK